MKYVVASKARPLGSVKDTEEAVPRLLELLTKWTPPEGMTVHQLLTSLDGAGEFIIVETDNPADLVTAASAFGPFYRVPDLSGHRLRRGRAGGAEGYGVQEFGPEQGYTKGAAPDVRPLQSS